MRIINLNNREDVIKNFPNTVETVDKIFIMNTGKKTPLKTLIKLTRAIVGHANRNITKEEMPQLSMGIINEEIEKFGRRKHLNLKEHQNA